MVMTQEEARERLLDPVDGFGLKPGDTVYTVLRHVSSSGMTRWIDLYAIDRTADDGRELVYLSPMAAWAMGERVNVGQHDGIKRGGCGMDMGFDLVYSLSRVLFRDGYDCIGQRCPGNDHHNPPYPERVAGGMRHRDGGYALNHRWI